MLTVYTPFISVEKKMYFFESERDFSGTIDASLIFAGITRNSSKYIERSLGALSKMGSRFNTHKIVIYENDSEDNTVELLRNSPVDLLTETHGVPPYSGTENCTTESLKRLAQYRAKLQQYILKNYYADFVAVVDFDLMAISWDGFFSCFFYQDWDAMGADCKCTRIIDGEQRFLFYDFFAYRNKGQKKADSFQNDKYAEVRKTNELIWVDSVFGGVCIYRWEAFQAGKYDASDGVCDHVYFHEEMRKQGFDKIYMNPWMTTIHE